MDTELLQNRLNPHRFSSTICQCLVLYLGTRTGHNGLLERTPRDKIGSKENSKTTSGAMIIKATDPISVDIKNIRRLGLNVNSHGGSTFNITKNPFDRVIVNSHRLR
jgi:hypothetical protein